MRIAALVLAAGAGERMGGPKALLAIDGVALVAQHVARFREAGCAPIVVVTRIEIAERVRALVGDEVDVVAAETASQAESLRVGEATLGGAIAFVTPVDLVPPALATLFALGAALTDDVAAVTPTHGGRGGHPVLVRLRELPSSVEPLRDRLDALGVRRVRVEVGDGAVLLDLDEPGDVSRAR